MGRLAAALAALGVAVAIGLAFLGARHTAVVLGVLLAIAALTWTGSELVMRRRRRGLAGSLSGQLALAVALVIGPLLVGLLVLGLLMFVSGQDAALVGVVVAVTGVLGLLAAHRLGHAFVTDVGRVRDGLLAVGHGRRDLRLGAPGAVELRELAEAANAMIARLSAEEAARDQSEAARRHLVAAASHDLRTPITSLRLLAQAIDDRVVDGPTRAEYVRRMLTHIDALSALIDDLFELSRLEAGDITWSLQRVAVGELVSDTVAAMRVHAEAKGIEVSAELPGSLDVARANPEKLQRVLFNLIQNAIRHTPADGSVVVRAEARDGAVEVEIADSGEGIAEAERPLVFEPFYRGDASRSTNGAGLGLAVARAIVEAHGGRIWLASAPQGTRVRFSLPTAA
jgi:signal transduction histidine kinase